MQRYAKPAISFDEQLSLLESRGVELAQRDAARAALESIGFYRLSAYWYPFRIREKDGTVRSEVEPGTSFDEVLKLYEFDRKLRLLTLDAIDRIEISVRTRITYHMSHAYGPFAHTAAENFHHRFDHATWLRRVESETEQSSDKFIDHYENKYEGFPTVPIWMVTEVVSLGALSRLYRGLKNDDKRAVSNYFSVHYRRLQDWMHVLTYVRNVCAHHGRLWNRALAIRPESLREPEWQPPLTPRGDRIFVVLLILRQLLNASGNGDDWKTEIDQLLAAYAESPIYLKWMGVPEDWSKHPLW